MTHSDFMKYRERFKASLKEKSYEQLVRFRRFIADFMTRDEEAKIITDLMTKLDLEQCVQIMQILLQEEDLKKPSCKEEFNRIMRSGGF